MYPKERIPRLIQGYRDAKAQSDGTRAKHILRFLEQKGLKVGSAGYLHDEKGLFTGFRL